MATDRQDKEIGMKIGFIGCGNMGGALARAVMRSGCGEVFLYDKDTARAAELAKEIGANAAELSDITKCNYVFLGVKPGIIADVTAEIAPMISKDTVIVSMAAGGARIRCARHQDNAQHPCGIRCGNDTLHGIGRCDGDGDR